MHALCMPCAHISCVCPIRPSVFCENNALVRTTRGVGSATFGTMKFGASIFWLSMKIKFSSVMWGCGWPFGETYYCPAICCHTSGCPGVQIIPHGPGTKVVPLLVFFQGVRAQRPCQSSRRRCFRRFQSLYRCSPGGGGCVCILCMPCDTLGMPSAYPVHTLRMPCALCAYLVYALYMRRVCLMHALCMPCTCPVYALFTPCIRPVYCLCVPCVFAADDL